MATALMFKLYLSHVAVKYEKHIKEKIKCKNPNVVAI